MIWTSKRDEEWEIKQKANAFHFAVVLPQLEMEKAFVR